MTRTDEGEQPVAVITGASQGLGRALAQRLARAGWALVLDARRADRLAEAVATLGKATAVTAVVGDVAEPDHREALRQAATALGRVRLLVNNASTLGASPLPTVREVPLDVLRRTYEVNAVAPLALFQLFEPTLVDGGTVVNITSDAGAAAYAGWGVYGSSKAALEHWSRVLAEEQPTVRVLVVDPGDMRTEMHQAAFLGEDISDRPPPDTSADAIVALIRSDQPSGRYETATLPAEVK